jgi:hypothetical protein
MSETTENGEAVATDTEAEVSAYESAMLLSMNVTNAIPQVKNAAASKAVILANLAEIVLAGEQARKVYDDAVKAFQPLLAEYEQIKALYEGLATVVTSVRKRDLAEVPPFVKPGRKAKA